MTTRFYLSRHTGWHLVYGLRPEFSQHFFSDKGNALGGYEVQSNLGCLDAPVSIAGGAVQIYPYNAVHFVEEMPVRRG